MNYECKKRMGSRASRSPCLASRRAPLRQKKDGKCRARHPAPRLLRSLTLNPGQTDALAIVHSSIHCKFLNMNHLQNKQSNSVKPGQTRSNRFPEMTFVLQHPFPAGRLGPSMWRLFKEFLLFCRQEKKWWLIPLIVVLLVLGAILVFTASSGIAWALYPFM